MRMALAVAGVFVVAAAGAADWPVGPAPAWVRPVPFDAAAQPRADGANVAHGTRFDVIDDPVRLTATTRVRFRVVESGDPGRGSRRPFPCPPSSTASSRSSR